MLRGRIRGVWIADPSPEAEAQRHSDAFCTSSAEFLKPGNWGGRIRGSRCPGDLNPRSSSIRRDRRGSVIDQAIWPVRGSNDGLGHGRRGLPRAQFLEIRAGQCDVEVDRVIELGS